MILAFDSYEGLLYMLGAFAVVVLVTGAIAGAITSLLAALAGKQTTLVHIALAACLVTFFYGTVISFLLTAVPSALGTWVGARLSEGFFNNIRARMAAPAPPAPPTPPSGN